MFQQLWRVNITGCVIESPEHDLAKWRSASSCVIRILAERSLVQPTDKKKQEDLLDLITVLKKN